VDEGYPGFSISPASLEGTDTCEACESRREHPTIYKALEGVSFIATHHVDAYFAKHVRSRFYNSLIELTSMFQMKNDWVCMAMVVDRFLLWLYVTLTLICTSVLLLNAPALFDTRVGFGVRNKN
jgi:nicotinic acetylcholine receptor